LSKEEEEEEEEEEKAVYFEQGERRQSRARAPKVIIHSTESQDKKLRTSLTE